MRYFTQPGRRLFVQKILVNAESPTRFKSRLAAQGSPKRPSHSKFGGHPRNQDERAKGGGGGPASGLRQAERRARQSPPNHLELNRSRGGRSPTLLANNDQEMRRQRGRSWDDTQCCPTCCTQHFYRPRIASPRLLFQKKTRRACIATAKCGGGELAPPPWRTNSTAKI